MNIFNESNGDSHVALLPQNRRIIINSMNNDTNNT